MEGTSSSYGDAEDGWRYEAACELLPSEGAMSSLDERMHLPEMMRIERCDIVPWLSRWRRTSFAISSQLLGFEYVLGPKWVWVDCTDPDLW